MNILSYFHVLVNIRALSASLIHKGSFFFGILLIARYYIKIERNPS